MITLLAQESVAAFVMYIYWAGLVMSLGLVASILVSLWKGVFIRLQNADARVHPSLDEFILKGSVTAILLIALVGIAGYGYSLTLARTAPAASPMNPLLEENLLEAQLHKEAAPELLAEQKAKREELNTKRHTEAITSFEERMAIEAQKIKERNPQLQDKQ